jgi:hypothetical protein
VFGGKHRAEGDSVPCSDPGAALSPPRTPRNLQSLPSDAAERVGGTRQQCVSAASRAPRRRRLPGGPGTDRPSTALRTRERLRLVATTMDGLAGGADALQHRWMCHPVDRDSAGASSCDGEQSQQRRDLRGRAILPSGTSAFRRIPAAGSIRCESRPGADGKPNGSRAVQCDDDVTLDIGEHHDAAAGEALSRADKPSFAHSDRSGLPRLVPVVGREQLISDLHTGRTYSLTEGAEAKGQPPKRSADGRMSVQLGTRFDLTSRRPHPRRCGPDDEGGPA